MAFGIKLRVWGDYACFTRPALQEILGHSTIVTTQRYARLGQTHVLEEAKRIGSVVTKVVTEEEAHNA